jgi:hypothetical protein
MIDLIREYSIYIIPLLIVVIGWISKSYYQEKGKLFAQIQANKKLVSQTEEIKIIYSKELEEVKKTHQLEISKRKYQYESKKEQYIKFFNLLDNFNMQSTITMQEKLIPIFQEFNKNFLQASTINNKKQENQAITVMTKSLQSVLLESKKELIQLRNETNTIKLIASDRVLYKLTELSEAYDVSSDLADKVVKALPSVVMLGENEIIKKFQNVIEDSSGIILEIKNEIIYIMRDELDEI